MNLARLHGLRKTPILRDIRIFAPNMASPLLLRPTARVAALGDGPRGLSLVRYGGGDAIRAATVLLHACAPMPATPAWAPLRARVQAAAAAALARAAADGAYAAEHLPAPGAPLGLDAADGAAWEVALVVSETPPGAPPGAPALEATRACLFHHGWLHGDAVAASADGGGVQAYPLIGAFAARGSCRADPGDGDMWDFLAAPLARADVEEGGWGNAPPLALAPFDQHAHQVDAHNGLGRELFIEQVMAELGQTRAEAEERADAEAAAAALDGWHIGADGARVQVSGAEAGAMWVACVDARREGGRPARALLSLLLVVAPAAREAVRAVARGIGAEGAAPRDVLARLAAAVPALAPLVEGAAAEPF